MSETKIQLEDETDRWRWVCPRGHRSWEPTNNHFWCVKCARNCGDEVGPLFHELHDKKTDETVDRDDLRLVTPAGPYRDVNGEGEPA